MRRCRCRHLPTHVSVFVLPGVGIMLVVERHRNGSLVASDCDGRQWLIASDCPVSYKPEVGEHEV